MSVLETLILLSILVSALITDLKSKTIRNSLICSGGAIIITIRIITAGLTGAVSFFLGGLIPILVLLILFVFRMLGAGDIKLLVLTGGVTGPGGIIPCIIYSFLYGAFFSLAKMLYKKNLIVRLHYLAAYFTKTMKEKSISPYYVQETGDANVICFSACILLGFITYLFTGGV